MPAPRLNARVRVTRQGGAGGTPAMYLSTVARHAAGGRFFLQLDGDGSGELDSAAFGPMGVTAEEVYPELGARVSVQLDGSAVWRRGRVCELLQPEPAVRIRMDEGGAGEMELDSRTLALFTVPWVYGEGTTDGVLVAEEAAVPVDGVLAAEDAALPADGVLAAEEAAVPAGGVLAAEEAAVPADGVLAAEEAAVPAEELVEAEEQPAATATAGATSVAGDKATRASAAEHGLGQEAPSPEVGPAPIVVPLPAAIAAAIAAAPAPVAQAQAPPETPVSPANSGAPVSPVAPVSPITLVGPAVAPVAPEAGPVSVVVDAVAVSTEASTCAVAEDERSASLTCRGGGEVDSADSAASVKLEAGAEADAGEERLRKRRRLDLEKEGLGCIAAPTDGPPEVIDLCSDSEEEAVPSGKGEKGKPGLQAETGLTKSMGGGGSVDREVGGGADEAAGGGTETASEQTVDGPGVQAVRAEGGADWRAGIERVESCHHIISRLSTLFQGVHVNALPSQAGAIEADAFQNANSREDYFRLLSEGLVKALKKRQAGTPEAKEADAPSSEDEQGDEQGDAAGSGKVLPSGAPPPTSETSGSVSSGATNNGAQVSGAASGAVAQDGQQDQASGQPPHAQLQAQRPNFLQYLRARCSAASPAKVAQPGSATRSDARDNAQPGERLQCPYCVQMLANVQNLRNHVGLLHSAEGSALQKAKRKASRLSIGRPKVIGGGVAKKPRSEKQFVCELCPAGKAFGQKAGLKRHHELVHLQLKPYKCNVCGKSFGTNGNLKVHALVHDSAHQNRLQVANAAVGGAVVADEPAGSSSSECGSLSD